MKIKLPNFKKVGNLALGMFTFFTIIAGTLGFAITAINPVNLWWKVAPIETPFGIITYSMVMSYLDFLQQYYYYSLGTSAFTILLGLAVHLRSLSTLINGIKAAPMAILKSPITLYKDIKRLRDWLFGKIEYLNGESTKWRNFFNVMKSPYSLLRGMGLNPQMAIGLLIAGGTAGTAVTVNELVIERSFANGSPGIYAAPSQFPDETLEKEMAWRKDNPQDNTLRIVLGTTPVELISISDVSIGTAYTGSALPSGKAEAILIEGKSGQSARLEIGELLFDRTTCKTLTLSDVKAHKIVIQDNIADGLSIAQTLTSTLRNLRVSGGNFMADLLQTEGGTYDRIWLDTGILTSGKAKINKLELSNIVSTGGTCVIRQADIGVLTIQFSQIGHDSNLATKEFTVQSSTVASIWEVNNNLEVLLSEPTPPGQVSP
jgi:hypothetical protein